ELEQQIAKLNMNNKIVLLGYRTDVKELLASCGCFILPSRREGFGLSPVEAAAMGKSVIFSDTGIGFELLGDITPNFLLRVDNEEDIEQALRSFLKLTPVQRYENGQKLLLKVKNNFSHSLMVQKTEDIYRKTLGI
ncbi:MAG: glycosyltransferase family 4 protein, partial [Lentisphaeria bacterium]